MEYNGFKDIQGTIPREYELDRKLWLNYAFGNQR